MDNVCQNCGADNFEEVDGLLFCRTCQTQSQGFTQEVGYEDVFVATQEIRTKKIKEKGIRKTGIKWTTLEAFNHIVLKQAQVLSQLEGLATFKTAVFHIWVTYCRSVELAFCKNEVENLPKLHPATRYRDIQILHKNCEDIPVYKNASGTNRKYTYRMGNDVVINYSEDSDNDSDELESEDYHFEKNWRTKKPKAATSSHSKPRKEIKEVLLEFDLNYSYENTLGILEKEAKAGSSITNQELESENIPEEIEKRSLETLTSLNQKLLKVLPLEYLSKSRNMYALTETFVELMSLSKTLAILNIALRKRGDNIFVCDLIRWANDYSIPYFNSLNHLPKEWKILPNDIRTFTPISSPSFKNINIITAKIASRIRLKDFPNPDMKALVLRFLHDLNLPLEIADIIDIDYNLFQHFFKELDTSRHLKKFPSFDHWAFLAIVLVLKVFFGLDGTTEYKLSELATEKNNLFSWKKWERFTRLRLQLMKLYYVPFFEQNLNDICDVEVIKSRYLQKLQASFERIALTSNRATYNEDDFRRDLQRFFQCDKNAERPSVQFPSPTLYPLTAATELSLGRHNIGVKNAENVSILSEDFKDKTISPYRCSHGRTFHRPYIFLNIKCPSKTKNLEQMTPNFDFLFHLGTIVLECDRSSLYVIYKKLENKFFKVRKVCSMAKKGKHHDTSSDSDVSSDSSTDICRSSEDET